MTYLYKFFAAATMATALVTVACAQDVGTALKQEDLKAEPFKDAETVGSMKKGESVTLLKKKSGWVEVKAGNGTGWVRVLSVRKGGSGTAAGEIAGIAGAATGRAGTGQVVSTTGVRGLSDEEMKGAIYSEAEVKLAEAAAVSPEEARDFAAKAELIARQVNWLPEPKSTTQGAR